MPENRVEFSKVMVNVVANFVEWYTNRYTSSYSPSQHIEALKKHYLNGNIDTNELVRLCDNLVEGGNQVYDDLPEKIIHLQTDHEDYYAGELLTIFRWKNNVSNTIIDKNSKGNFDIKWEEQFGLVDMGDSPLNENGYFDDCYVTKTIQPSYSELGFVDSTPVMLLIPKSFLADIVESHGRVLYGGFTFRGYGKLVPCNDKFISGINVYEILGIHK